MATNKKKMEDAAARSLAIAAYEKAVVAFGAAMDLVHKGDFAAARDGFEGVLRDSHDEPVLAERARTYAVICTRRLAGSVAPPSTLDEHYYRAVMLSNNGDSDQAIHLLDQALQQEPRSSRLLYARASAWALKGNADAAVSDLREAIATDPKIRFQAINDADFEQIREEPAFIDIIEPTPTGA